MAPPMKELPRWLLDNPEFSVAPDWTDIVKQSVSNYVKKTKTTFNIGPVLPIDGLSIDYCIFLSPSYSDPHFQPF